ncbi:hypothetical protein LUQ84_000317 [Hamiltosporidium tvaerminnensis]|nr:hypothetical protein LUQ84_000317 [Hamiltosporidium tvaerminnensis]
MMKIIKILLLASNSNTAIISNLTKEFEISINDLKIEFFFFFIRQFIDLLSTKSYECAIIFLKKAISIHPQAVHTYLSVADSEINLSLDNILDSLKSQEVLEERLNIENEFINYKEDINVLHDLLTNTNLSSVSYNDISLCKIAHERLNNLMSFYKTHHGFTCFTVDMVINNILQIFESNNEEHSFIVIDFLLKHIFDNYSNFDLRNNKGLEALLNRMLGVLSLSKICQKYYDEFKNDFFSTTEISLSQVFAKVYKWKYIIENMMKSMPYNIRLDVLSSFLIDYENAKYSEIYVFGQYIPIKESYHNLVKIESFEPVVMLSWKNGYCIRKLEIRGSNGKKYFFAMHSHDTSLYKREEKIMQAAMFLDKEVECGTEFLFSMNDMDCNTGGEECVEGNRNFDKNENRNTGTNENRNTGSTNTFRSTGTTDYGTTDNRNTGSKKGDLGRSNASVLALKRKNARLSPKLAIRISYKIRLVSFRQSYFFLDDILNEWCTRIGYSYHYLAIKYMKYVDELAGRAVFFGCENDEDVGCSISVVNSNEIENNGDNGEGRGDGKQPEDCFMNIRNSSGDRLSSELKLGAYRKMVEFVSDSILKDRFLDYCGDFDVYFSFRKNFGVSFGSISWFIYMLGAYNREPSKLAIGLCDGSYYSLDVVPCLEEKYIFKNNESVNVRLTPNIQKFLGKEGVEGQMVSLFYNYSVFVKRGCLSDLIYVVINEDASFSEQLFFYKGLDEEKRIGFEKNIRVVMERMDMCCDGKKLLKMLNSSMDPENLCLMPLSWHPWY